MRKDTQTSDSEQNKRKSFILHDFQLFNVRIDEIVVRQMLSMEMYHECTMIILLFVNSKPNKTLD